MPENSLQEAHGNWPTRTFLARLGDDARRNLLGLAPPRAYGPGRVLLHQGESSSHVFILTSARPGASACVKVSARLANGTEILLGIRVSGDAVGELGVLRGSTRQATVTTCSPTNAYVIPHREFMGFLRRYPEGWPAISGMIADRLDWANQRRLDFVGYSVPVRLARVLTALTERHGSKVEGGHDLGVRLSQEELGRLIGAGKDAIGKAIGSLKDAGLITVHYRGIVVRSVARLRSYADLSEP
ncbi:Crp/Fnr family transcriptional regulator [Nonomuraea sp. SBT364]|uniref:Crp/Fnr family transcriptional regulator n=1 Tax=Nonomuraea sp. SBT364 TaxID=1580530 RepID=UPI00066AD651|nr:Crp/Fnr family transcriptional regulator [Nonomuraea sp. SBT364]